MEEQIQKYIEQARQVGQRDEEIKQSLLAVGWSEKSLAPFFRKKQRRMTKGAFFTIIILCTIIPIGVGAYFIFTQTGLFSNNTTKEVQQTNTDQGEVAVVDTKEQNNNDNKVICEPSTPRDSLEGLNFLDLINDTERAERCQEIYNNINYENLSEYPNIGGLNGCIRYAIIDTNDYSLCSIMTNEGVKDGCYYGAALSRGLSCECENIIDENNKKTCYEESPVILQQMTLDDFPDEFQVRPEPIEHQLYDDPELIENFEGDYPDGTYTINYDYHFSSYDPNECIPLIAGTPNPYNTDPYERMDFDGCIMGLAEITADETVCDLLDTVEHQNRCKNIMAYWLESPVMCFSIIRPNNLTEEAQLAYNFSGSFSQCMYDSIIMGVTSEELCALLGDTIDGNLAWQEECNEELEDYLEYQEVVDDRETVEGAVLADPYNNDIVFTNLITADGLVLPKTINGNLSFKSLTSAQGLVLPEVINGGLWFHDLTSAQGLVLPNTITSSLYLYGLESTEGLVLPKSIGSIVNIGISSLSKEEQSELESKYPEINIQFSL